jgi:hypothetical protein
MKIRARIRHEDKKSLSWEEAFTAPDGTNPEEYFKSIIEYFNATLKPGEMPRVFVSCEVEPEDLKAEDVELTLEDVMSHTCPSCKEEDVFYEAKEERLQLDLDLDIEPYFSAKLECDACGAWWQIYEDWNVSDAEYHKPPTKGKVTNNGIQDI